MWPGWTYKYEPIYFGHSFILSTEVDEKCIKIYESSAPIRGTSFEYTFKGVRISTGIWQGLEFSQVLDDSDKGYPYNEKVIVDGITVGTLTTDLTTEKPFVKFTPAKEFTHESK